MTRILLFTLIIVLMLAGIILQFENTEIILAECAGARNGNPKDERNLGILLRDGRHLLPHPDESFRWLSKAAEGGDIEAEFQLALNYFEGIGTSPNNEMAMQWLRKAANAGHRKAQELLILKQKLGTDRGSPSPNEDFKKKAPSDVRK